MSLETKKTSKGDAVLAFLLGISVCEGISMMFSVGNTSFSFAEVFSPLVFLFFCLTRLNEIVGFVRKIPIGFKLFAIIIVLSVIPGVVYFSSIAVMSRYVVGLISLFIVLTMAANIYVLKQSRDCVVKGLLIGVVLNTLFSIICYISFTRGEVITLSTVFPHPSFFVPGYNFRAQGFFLEPSHYIRFIATVLLVVVSQSKVKSFVSKALFFVMLLLVLALSTSGTVVILAVGVAIFAMMRKNDRNPIYRIILAILITAIALLVYFAVFGSDSLKLSGLVGKILSGADISSEGNSERYNAMIESLGYIGGALIGCGWNMVGTLFDFHGSKTVAAFSDVLEMTLELGIVGVFVYAISIISLILRLLRKKSDYSIALALSVAMIFAIQIGTDYAFNSCIMLLFGLTIAELSGVEDNMVK